MSHPFRLKVRGLEFQDSLVAFARECGLADGEE